MLRFSCKKIWISGIAAAAMSVLMLILSSETICAAEPVVYTVDFSHPVIDHVVDLNIDGHPVVEADTVEAHAGDRFELTLKTDISYGFGYFEDEEFVEAENDYYAEGHERFVYIFTVPSHDTELTVDGSFELMTDIVIDYGDEGVVYAEDEFDPDHITAVPIVRYYPDGTDLTRYTEEKGWNFDEEEFTVSKDGSDSLRLESGLNIFTLRLTDAAPYYSEEEYDFEIINAVQSGFTRLEAGYAYKYVIVDSEDTVLNPDKISVYGYATYEYEKDGAQMVYVDDRMQIEPSLYEVYTGDVSGIYVSAGYNTYTVRLKSDPQETADFIVYGATVFCHAIDRLEVSFLGDPYKYSIGDTIDRNDIEVIPVYKDYYDYSTGKSYYTGRENWIYKEYEGSRLSSDEYTLDSDVFDISYDSGTYTAGDADDEGRALIKIKNCVSVSYTEEEKAALYKALKLRLNAVYRHFDVEGYSQKKVYSRDDIIIKLNKKKFGYTGAPIEPEFSVYVMEPTGRMKSGHPVMKKTLLAKGVDYVFSYEHNVESYTRDAYIDVVLIGDRRGEKQTAFDIVQKKFSSLKLAGRPSVIYTGDDMTPEIEAAIVLLDKNAIVPRTCYETEVLENGNEEYTIGSPNKVRTVRVGIRCSSNMYRSKFRFDSDDERYERIVKVRILPTAPANIDLTGCTVRLKKGDDYTYTGSLIRPSVSVYDKDGKKIKNSLYAVNYSDNLNAGTGHIVITGIEPVCSGELTYDFNIHKKDFETIKIKQTRGAVINSEIDKMMPYVADNKRRLKRDVDYTLSLNDSSDLKRDSKGRVLLEITVTPIGNYEGEPKTAALILLDN